MSAYKGGWIPLRSPQATRKPLGPQRYPQRQQAPRNQVAMRVLELQGFPVTAAMSNLDVKIMAEQYLEGLPDLVDTEERNVELDKENDQFRAENQKLEDWKEAVADFISERNPDLWLAWLIECCDRDGEVQHRQNEIYRLYDRSIERDCDEDERGQLVVKIVEHQRRLVQYGKTETLHKEMKAGKYADGSPIQQPNPTEEVKREDNSRSRQRK